MIRYSAWCTAAGICFAGVIPGMPIVHWAFGLPAAALLGVVSAIACWWCLGRAETASDEMARQYRRRLPRVRCVIDQEGRL